MYKSRHVIMSKKARARLAASFLAMYADIIPHILRSHRRGVLGISLNDPRMNRDVYTWAINNTEV